jgi:hypothetical protein
MLNQQRRSIPQSEDQPSGGNRQVEELTLAMQGANGAVAMPDVTQYRPRGNQSWRWLLISLMSCFAASGAAIGAFVWLINLPPTADCDNAAAITTDRAQLYCAQVAAESGEFNDILASLKLVGSWTSSHPLYYEVQPLVEQWSRVTLQEAQKKLNDSDLTEAVALIDHIPASSSVYETAQESLQAWNTEWEQGNALWQTAQAALKAQDWGTASQQIMALSELGNRHWRVDQVQALSRQIRLERQARKQLTKAIEVASPGGVAQLSSALRNASQIDQTTFAHQDAQPYLDRWADWLLNLGLDKWYASELDQAINLGRTVSLHPNRAKAAQELTWLSRSRQMAQRSVGTWRTAPEQLMQLYRAMVMANQIPQDSLYYPQAQSSVATWRTHLADLGKLQIAQTAGRVQNLDTLKLAIDQAAKVPLGHPRRLQAQTLMAHWRLEVERLEDRPYLAQAHQLADANTIDGFQQAIESASQIPINRALRNEAQSWIYVWHHQIQVLEDRPTLAQARALAAGGNYSQAIAAATGINPGRALYDEAQGAIAGWRREIYAIERARQQALQRAAAQRAAANAPTLAEETVEEAANSQAPDEVITAPGAAPQLLQRQPLAPAPVQTKPLRQSLPARIETIPGNRAPAVPEQPTMPTLSPPPALLEQAPPETPANPPAEEPVDLSPPPITAPETQPAPLEKPVPATIPELSAPAPIPTAPAPQLLEIPPAQNEALAPAPVPAVPEATIAPGQPSVSAAPTPEQSVSVKITKDATVLYTGALYAGR